MEPNKFFIDLIKNKKEVLTKSENKIVDFIIKNKHKTTLMTAKQISEKTQVGASTVIRLAKNLGYKSFSHMQSSLQDEFINHKLDKRLESFDINLTQNSVIEESIKLDISNIENTFKNLNPIDLDGIIELVGKAKDIYTLGFRSSMADASYLSSLLGNILENTWPITSTGVILNYCLKNSNEESVIFVFSFPRYTKQTIEIAKFLKNNNKINLILITDSIKNPLIEFSDYFFLTSVQSTNLLYSHIASFSLINAIASSINIAYRSRVEEHLANLENYYNKSNIFYL